MSRGPSACAISPLDASRAVGEAEARGEKPWRRPSRRLRDALLGYLARRARLSPQAAPAAQTRQGGDQAKARREPAAPAAQFKDDVLRFLVDFDVPFTNNLAEQALRMMKVKMKISGAFRTFDAAHDFASLRTVVATARKQGWNILQTLTAQPNPIEKQSNPEPPPWELLTGANCRAEEEC